MGALPDLHPSSTHCPSWRLSPHGRRRQPPLPWQRAAAHRRAPPSPSSATTTRAGPPPLHLQPPVVHATRRCAALHLAPASDLHNREPPRRWASIALDLRSLPCTSAQAGDLTPAPLFSASISASGRSSHRPELKLTRSDVPCRPPFFLFFISNLSSSLRSRLSLSTEFCRSLVAAPHAMEAPPSSDPGPPNGSIPSPASMTPPRAGSQRFTLPMMRAGRQVPGFDVRRERIHPLQTIAWEALRSPL